MDNYDFSDKKILLSVDCDEYNSIKYILNFQIKYLVIVIYGKHSDDKNLKYFKNIFKELRKYKINFINNFENLNDNYIYIIFTDNDSPNYNNLSRFFDIYVNDCSNILLENDIKENIKGIKLTNEINLIKNINEKSLTVILGGIFINSSYKSSYDISLSKIKKKYKFIKKILHKINNVIIVGTFCLCILNIKYNINIGNSILDDKSMDVINNIYKLLYENNINIYLPKDHIFTDNVANPKIFKCYTFDIINNIGVDNFFVGLDIGKNSVNDIQKILENSKSVLLYGIAGAVDYYDFRKGTFEIIKCLNKTKYPVFVNDKNLYKYINALELMDSITYYFNNNKFLLEHLKN